MPTVNLTIFFNGVSTAYFAINAAQILTRNKRTRLQTILGVIFAYWALMTAKDMILFMPGHYHSTLLDAVQIADGWGALTVACLLFEITMPGWVTLRRMAMLAIPFFIFTIAYIIIPTHTVATIYMGFLALFGTTILRIGYAKAEQYTRYLYGNFSDIENMNISWLRKVYVAGFIYMLLWVVTSVMRSPIADSLIYVAAIPLWQIALHNCMKLKPVKPEPNDDEAEIPAGNDSRYYPFAGIMEDIVEREELYLNPKLSLVHLAARLGTNRTYLSNYFNNVKGTTFYDYINSLRVLKKSIPLMQTHPEYSFDYVARQSGFNSLSTFQRAFSKHTGTTPGKYFTKKG